MNTKDTPDLHQGSVKDIRQFLSPLEYLSQQYASSQRTLSFSAGSLGEWQVWRDQLRAKLLELLGVEASPPAPTWHTQAIKDQGDYVRETVLMESPDGVTMPTYILIPKSLTSARGAVLALHGHGYGANEIVGLTSTGEERLHPEGYQKDFALELVKRGFIVAVPELMGFGQRREETDKQQGAEVWSCRQASLLALLLGKTMLGMRLTDTLNLVTYLGTRSEIDKTRIGCMGISGGGMLALFLAALDERISSVVVSGYFNTFFDSIGVVRHCECNYVPGLLQVAEMYDVAGLVAPRPLLIEHGTLDWMFPIEATRTSFEKLKVIYGLLRASDKVALDSFGGEHQIYGKRAYDWLLGGL
jgi:dienelactone hydrolase